MPLIRTFAPARAALTIAGAALLLLTSAACGPRDASPVLAPSDLRLATVPAKPAKPSPAPADVRSLAARLGAQSKGTLRLEAVRTAALYCRLVDQGLLVRAGDLCTKRALWSRETMGSVRHVRFRSARIYAAPDARTLVLKARVRVLAGRGCPLPDGLAVVFFTLGRVGTAVGGWLITAVSTSPQSSRKGSI